MPAAPAAGRSRPPLRSATAHVAVVGAGLSGLELAAALVHRGVDDVLVVERGDADTASAQRRGGWRSTLPPHYLPAPVGPRLGGRSLRWHGVVLRLEDWALNDGRWPASVVGDLRGRGSRASLYDQVEEDLRRWAGGHLCGATPAGDRELVHRLREWGLAGARAVPQAVRPATCADGAWEAYSPLGRWLDLSSGHGPARTLPAVEALEVTASAGRVTGLRLRDRASRRQLRVDCPLVVLAAGALENARLVAQVLGEPASGPVRVVDHLVQGFCLRLPAEAAGALPPCGFGVVAGDARSRSNLFVRIRQLDGPGGPLLDAWAMGEQEMEGATAVMFAPGPAPRRAVVRPSLSDGDRRLIAAQQRDLQVLWQALAAALGRPASQLRFAPFLDAPAPFPRARGAAMEGRAGVPRTYTWPLGAVEHEGGSLPLGGPLSPDAEVHGARGLYVVGPAVFPRAGAANPSLTTLALARRTALAVAAA